MAKKVDDELANPYRRDISVMIPTCLATKPEVDAEWSDVEGAWLPIPSLTIALYCEDSIDLSGYANQYLTFFIEGSITQEHPARTITGTNAAGMYDATVISSVPLDIDEYLQDVIYFTSPGMPKLDVTAGTNVNPEHILYSRVMLSLLDSASTSDIGVTRPIDVGQLGTLEATAADKLFVYRIVIPIGQLNNRDYTSIGAPAQRIVLQGTMAEEPTIEYMMRLKRSYELANQV